MLTIESFANKIKDFIKFDPDMTSADMQLLRIGRHLRLTNGTKMVIGRDENDKISAAGLTLTSRHSIPFIDEGNMILLCEKMSATRLTEDSFLMPEIAQKWYADHDMHTMYIAEIIDILAR